MKQDEFLIWLFEKFNMPESRYIDLTRIYGKALPENSDFEHLKNAVIKEWESLTTLPTTNWLRYRAHPKKETREWGTPCEALIQAEENRKYSEEHREECLAAMNKFLDEVEKIWGRRPGRKQCS